MSIEIVMPQMGESITEGTISKWLKKVGDEIEKDEAILEISTDKVDAEVPSSGSGVLLEIRFREGETVEVGTVVAIVGETSEASASVSSVISPQTSEVATPKAEDIVVKQNILENQKLETPSSDATPIVMPQMGESITEGTISKWLKKVGDEIEKDEAILEISTDKVDAEVPSSVSGTLLEIRHQEGETVEVGTIVATVGSKNGISAPIPAAPIVVAPVVTTPIPAAPAISVATTASSASIESLRQTKSSPLVRNIAKEHGVDLGRIQGTGQSGRVTKQDILGYLDTGAALKPQDLLIKPISATQVAAPPINVGDKVEAMSNMRQKIAERMISSKHTAAHVTSVYEIDMTNIVRFRAVNKNNFESRYGTKLTYMPFIFLGVCKALRQFPVVNAQVSGNNIVYKGNVNLGLAVALDWGLIVPVIKNADQLSLSGLCLQANDLADRARMKKLKPDEVQDGTFTVTNTGTFGGLFGTPIIPQPQSAILNFGIIEKRPKVVTTPEGEDYIAIRSMAYFALTYDHRIIDGADAERFLSYLKEYLETNQFAI